MTTISDDTLMAYADGELDAAQAATIEAALANDATLAQRIEAHRRLRRRVDAAFALPANDEPVPDRFAALLQPAPAARVIDLATARKQRRWSWAHWGGMAASVALGLVLGRTLLAPADAELIVQRGGALVAGGPLGRALDAQLASAPQAGQAVAVPISFVADDGRYCRGFATDGAAGLACRDGAQWRIEMLARAPSQPAAAMRQAASPLPPEVLAAVQARMAGDALDARAEQAARDAGWRR